MNVFAKVVILILSVSIFNACDIIKFESKKDKKPVEQPAVITVPDNKTQTTIITNDAEVAQMILQIETLKKDLESLNSIVTAKDMDIEQLSENNGQLKTANTTLQNDNDKMKRLQMILLIVSIASIILNVIMFAIIIKRAKKNKPDKSGSTSYMDSSIGDIINENNMKEKAMNGSRKKPTIKKPVTKKTAVKKVDSKKV